MVVRFQDLWEKMNISYDEFIRTTDPRHIKVVQDFFRLLDERGYIYLGDYEGGIVSLVKLSGRRASWMSVWLARIAGGL